MFFCHIRKPLNQATAMSGQRVTCSPSCTLKWPASHVSSTLHKYNFFTCGKFFFFFYITCNFLWLFRFHLKCRKGERVCQRDYETFINQNKLPRLKHCLKNRTAYFNFQRFIKLIPARNPRTRSLPSFSFMGSINFLRRLNQKARPFYI